MSVFSMAANSLLLDHYDSSAVLTGYGMIEVFTVSLLISFASGSLAKFQASLVMVAWLLHLVAYIDLEMGTNIVYSKYELLIISVVLIQLSLGFNGIISIFKRAYSKCLATFDIGGSGIPSVSVRNKNAKTGQEG